MAFSTQRLFSPYSSLLMEVSMQKRCILRVEVRVTWLLGLYSSQGRGLSLAAGTSTVGRPAVTCTLPSFHLATSSSQSYAGLWARVPTAGSQGKVD